MIGGRSTGMVVAVMLAFVLGSCTGQQQQPPATGTTEVPRDCACTAYFGSIGMQVVDGSGNPVSPDSVRITVKRTGEVVNPMPFPPGATAPGAIVVADDSDEVRKKISQGPEGDVLIVEVTARNTTRSVEIEVGYDQPCLCHIQKLSGPEKLELP